MRGADITQEELFSFRTLEARIPKSHPLRKLRAVVDILLSTLDDEFGVLYAFTGRESIPPERLLRASLLQILFSIRSERQLMEQIDFNLLFRWFIGLTMDGEVWDHSTFSANRERLLNERMSRLFFERVLALAKWKELVSDEHFSVDGTLIQAWVSMKSFVRKDGSTPPPEDQSRNPSVDFKGEKRSNDTHASTTDPDARLYKKGDGDKSQLCFMGHVLMENRNGLVVDVEVTHATGTAERGAAKDMVKRSIAKPGATLGADKGYDTQDFVAAMRTCKVTPHVAQKAKGSAIDKRTTRHKGYRTGLKVRKRIEEVFGWSKTVGGLRQTKFRGLQKVAAQAVFTFAAYNLTRLSSIFGWRYSTA
ncbi:IS5 family transposase [Methylomicrobium sp. Wu6]|uniref:IS5 family transposase n=1 Tax=Methylomicrobium sp. Wu6 TaxID=3107928 RepID=UPI002DD6215F|nr:IS5 family transposase [Methylomicrobium sp. Wu6]MEC4749604.1 IS5 family transposase [Methylomicrobium sp. Wu6]